MDCNGSGSCGKQKTATHLNCSTTDYCGKEPHEKRQQHWLHHNQESKPYQLLSSPVLGRYFVSSEQLRPGQELFEETAVAVGPQSESPLQCLGCHNFITGPDIPRCPKCWWPLCSLECAKAPRHRDECPILAVDTKHIGIPQQEGATMKYDIILTLRCLLLRDHNPEAWSKVVTMAHHSDKRVSDQEIPQVATVQYLLDVLHVDHSPAQVHQVKGAISTNAFTIRSEHNTVVRGVYPQIALFNHACTPNVHLSSSSDSVMKARTTSTVEPGAPLYISYTGTMVPLWERQYILGDLYHFICECSRCNDPTENGTHFSSPHCPECKINFLEPNRWLGITYWVCPSCNTEESDATVQEGVVEWMERLQMDDVFGGSSIKQAISMLDQVQEEFHATHYMWMKVAQMVLYKMRHNDSYKAMQLKRRIWQRLSALYSALEPGLTKRRGMSLLETGSVMLQEARMEYEEGQVYIPVFLQRLPSIEALLKEATMILSMEPPGSQMKALADRAEVKRKEAQEFIQSLSPKEPRSE